MQSALRCIALLALLAGLANCGVSLQAVHKNLEEGRLVPEAAVGSPDFLNEYRHPLPLPRHGMADLAIALERGNLPARGGAVLVQVGISTLPPARRPVRVHALAFARPDPGAGELSRLEQSLGAIRRHTAALPGAAGFTLDVIQPIKGLSVQDPALLPARSNGKLKDFMTGAARLPFDGGEHHIVLLVGSYKGFLDLSGLAERDRQDLVDLGRILAAKSVTLSVLALGEQPDFGFLGQLAQAGGGTFSVATELLDYDAWIRDDLRARRAETLTEVQLALHAKNGARLVRVLAPAELRHTGSDLAHTVSGLKQGRQHALLVELEIPPRTQSPTHEALEVELTYHVASVKRYYQARETIAFRYVDDPNLALRHTNATVERSLLILQTQETLQSAAREIRNRRNFQAIALLTAQSRALKRAGEERKDAELSRDASILAQYADRLYDFDAEWFKSVRIWNDLGWDAERFRKAYK